VKIALVGCGFVADFYMLTLKLHPALEVVAAMDIDRSHADRFSAYWHVPVFYDADSLIKHREFAMVLNLTNPQSHYAVAHFFLQHGKHVYSEKPLALNFDEACELISLAESNNLLIGSAPCNHLGESGQALKRALIDNLIGTPKLVYAEMDDGFIALNPYHSWKNVSGAPWPYKDEFAVGCTLEHAGYYISWLLMCFGPVKRIVSFQSLQHPGKPLDNGVEGSDFSVACLEFKSGVVARLTCSIIAPHDHTLRIIGEKGVLYANDCWFYRTRVYYRSYLRIRRRFMLSPFKRKIPLDATGPTVRGQGANAMDFARGPAEMVTALHDNRRSYIPADFSLHATEVALAINNSHSENHAYLTKSTFSPLGTLGTIRF
jgi:predicted dehydrogenase